MTPLAMSELDNASVENRTGYDVQVPVSRSSFQSTVLMRRAVEFMDTSRGLSCEHKTNFLSIDEGKVLLLKLEHNLQLY
jgi:hypothetical protein